MRKKNIEKEIEKERSKYGTTLITYGSANKKNSKKRGAQRVGITRADL